MELKPTAPEDEWLTVALETDPRAMAELGGPWPADKARATHAQRVSGALDSAHWSFSIVPDPAIGPVGFIGVWASEWAGEALSETGWMVLPEHQGKGYASAALGALLERARTDDRWSDIHAFPGVTNGASNALCRKFGFEQLEGGEADYAGRRFPVNHWVWRAGTPDPTGDAPTSGSASVR